MMVPMFVLFVRGAIFPFTLLRLTCALICATRAGQRAKADPDPYRVVRAERHVDVCVRPTHVAEQLVVCCARACAHALGTTQAIGTGIAYKLEPEEKTRARVHTCAHT